MKLKRCLIRTMILTAGVTLVCLISPAQSNMRSLAQRVNYTDVPDCATVEDPSFDYDDDDSCPPLACAVDAIAKLQGVGQNSVLTHNSDKNAGEQLRACLGRKHGASKVLVVGHGAEGIIYTALANGNDKFFSSRNYDWKGVLKDLGPISSFTLWSCATGSGASGADLLKDIHTETSPTSVRAPTVDVFCDESGLYFVDSEEWLVEPASSTGSRPKENVRVGDAPLSDAVSTGHRPFDTAEVSSIVLLEIGFVAVELKNPDEISRLIGNLQDRGPLNTTGCPFARKRGKMVVNFKEPARKPMNLMVYDTGLLHDLGMRTLYYFGSRAFVSAWESLIAANQPGVDKLPPDRLH